MIYDNKYIQEISQWGWNRAVRTGNYNEALWPSRDRQQLYLGDIKFDETKKVTTLPDECTLYFDKSSNFPRMKLQNTKFKRCIKLDKADYIVINKSGELYKIEGALYKHEGRYILVHKRDFYSIAGSRNIDSVIFNAFPGATKIYEGTMCEYTNDSKYRILYQDGTYTKPFIYDSDLNKVVDKSFEVMSDESMQAVISMLKSPDASTINLGLQMLAGFNISECPGLITFILHSYPRWKGCYKSTTLTDNMLNELKISRYNINPAATVGEILNSSSKEELSRLIPFIEPVIKDYFKQQVDSYFYRIKEGKAPKVTINVEWPDSD